MGIVIIWLEFNWEKMIVHLKRLILRIVKQRSRFFVRLLPEAWIARIMAVALPTLFDALSVRIMKKIWNFY